MSDVAEQVTGLSTFDPEGRGASEFDDSFGSLTLPLDLRSGLVLKNRPSTGSLLDLRGVFGRSTQTAPEISHAATRYLRISTESPLPRLNALVHHLEVRLGQLINLDEGWNGAKALRTSMSAVRSAVEVTLGLAASDTMAPQIFPTPDGGLQLVWYVSGDSVEVDIQPDGAIFATAEMRDGRHIGDEEWSDGVRERLASFVAGMFRESASEVPA